MRDVIEFVALGKSIRAYASPTPRERHAMDRAMHAVVGGVAAMVELDREIDELRGDLLPELEAAAWPEGRPGAATPQERIEQAMALDAAYARLDGHPLRDAIEVLTAMRYRAEFIARVSTLVIEPVELRGLADLPLSDREFGELWAAADSAWREHDLGKAPASAPSSTG